jgi:hypothetical protein
MVFGKRGPDPNPDPEKKKIHFVSITLHSVEHILYTTSDYPVLGNMTVIWARSLPVHGSELLLRLRVRVDQLAVPPLERLAH